MSKLYARSKIKLENALSDFTKLTIDDAYVDDCCYNLQQAIEMMLKYMVEMTGHRFIETHDIRAQINMLDSVNAYIPSRSKLRAMATTINTWEAQSRYSNSFTATLDDIKEVIELAKDLDRHCASLVQII